MRFSRHLMTAIFVGIGIAGSACTDKALGQTNKDASTALDATKAGADKALDATRKAGDDTADAAKNVAQQAVDKTRALAVEVGEKTTEAASAAGAAMTDGWITTKIKAKFADETMLNGSDIWVETIAHVVTLKGHVPSDAARNRALAIARGTEGATGAVDHLVVR